MVLHSVVCKFTHGDTPAPLQTRVGGHHSRSNKLTVCHGGVLITGCPRTPHEGPPMQRSSLVNSRGERPGERGATQRAMDAARREELVLGWPTTGLPGGTSTRADRARLALVFGKKSYEARELIPSKWLGGVRCFLRCCLCFSTLV